MWFQYVESPSFDRRGLDPVSVLRQTMSGLAHLHSLSIGEGRQSPCSLSSGDAAGFGQHLLGFEQ